MVAQGTTPIPRLLAHEMGHIYGLQHSRIDGSTEDYKDPWDIMSAAADNSASDPEFSLIGPGLSAWNMRSRGWLDESRVWKGAGNTLDETITLRPLVRHDLSGYLAAELPGGYLAEFRTADGWDEGIPRAAVLIHRFEGGHSYLVPGNEGPDLVAGDSFGDPVPAGPQVDFFSSFERIEVLSIDSGANQAILRIRYRRSNSLFGVAIDPMALILSGRAYDIWVALHHPHVPKVADIQAVLRAMTPEERNAAVVRARTVAGYGKAFEEAIAALERSDQA